jgi:GST-like protein
MIDFYTSSSPNGAKVHILLEETGLEYELHRINLKEREHKKPEYLAINPIGKVPAIVDRDGRESDEVKIFESGAILLYLAEKSGQFLPADPETRWYAISWLMFQMAGLGPTLAQAGYFLNRAPEPVPRAVERFVTEAERIFGTIDRRLTEAAYLAGSYSIADIACFPWIRIHQRFGVDIEEYPSIGRWLEEISTRPAVQRGLAQL